MIALRRQTVLADARTRDVTAYALSTRVHVGAVSADKPLRPTPNIITGGDLKEYLDLLSPLIDSLDRDIANTMSASGESASELRKQADVLERFPLAIYPDGTVNGPRYVAKLRAKADALDARKISNEQRVRETAFVNNWRAFYQRWLKEADEVDGIVKQWPVSATSGGDWTKLQGFDLEYQQFDRRYRGFGLTPTMEIPPSAPDTPLASFAANIPWGWIAVIALVVGGAIVWGQIKPLRAAVAA